MEAVVLKEYEKRSECAVSALVEAQALVRKVAEPVPAGDSVKAAIGRASRRLKWNFNRTKSLWYADERAKVSGDELTQLRDVAKLSTTGGGDAVLARLDNLEKMVESIARVVAQDPDYYGPQLDTLRGALGAYRRSHSP